MAVEKHILQCVDWSRFDLEGWLYQCGAWMDQKSFTGSPSGAYSNPIAMAMMQATRELKIRRMDQTQKKQVIANYFMDEQQSYRNKKSPVRCQIDDNEARAVQRLVLDLIGISDVMDDWMEALIDRYFRGLSWTEMVREDRTNLDSRFDVKCGIAVLHSRYGFICHY